MSDLPLFDFLVYLVPGAFSALGFACIGMRLSLLDWRWLTRQRALFGVSAVIFVFAAGLLTHLMASWIFWQVQGKVLYLPVLEVTERFRATGALTEITKRVQGITGIKPVNSVDLYRYAQYLVLSEAGPVSYHVDRLQALSLLCRNLFVSCAFLVCSAYFSFAFWRQNLGRHIALLAATLLVSSFLVKGALDYSVAAKYGVYRGVLVMSER